MIIIINNEKYDITEFVNEHPGGKDVFIDGADMTAEFNKIGHSKHAIQLLEKYKICDKPIENVNKYDTDEIIEKISFSLFLYKKTIPIIKKLFTHEDYLNMHKILGGLVLSNFIYSIFDLLYSGCKGEFTIRQFKLEFFIFLFIHLVLSLSALQFHVPINSNYTTISIGQEYRLHSILFVIRHLLIILILYLLGNNKYSHVLIISVVLLNMYIADIFTYYYRAKEEQNGRLIGSLPFWSTCTSEIQTLLGYGYTAAQICTTFLLISLKSNIELNLCIIFVIQIMAFMGTLSKKGIINNFQWHLIFVLQYLIVGFLFIKNKNMVSFTNIISVFIIWILRTKLNVNKFFLWSCVSTIVVCINYVKNNTILVISLTVLWCIFNYFGLCFDKKREKNHNTIITNTCIPSTKLHVIDIETKKKLIYKPGQYFNIYIDKEKRPYTPINNDTSKKTIQFFIKDYENKKISEKICAMKSNMCIHIDGPFGKNFYNINEDQLIVNNTPIDSKYILMFYCGTGITPFYSVLNSIKTKTKYKFKLFGSLKNETENYFNIKQKIFYTNNKLTVKKINTIIKKYDPENTTILVCGSDNYMKMFNTIKNFTIYNW